MNYHLFAARETATPGSPSAPFVAPNEHTSEQDRDFSAMNTASHLRYPTAATAHQETRVAALQHELQALRKELENHIVRTLADLLSEEERP